MYRQVFIPTMQTIFLNIPKEWFGKEIEVIAFPIESGSSNNRLSYSYLQHEKHRQVQLLPEEISKNILTDDVFTSEQEAEFNRKVTVDDIFNRL